MSRNQSGYDRLQQMVNSLTDSNSGMSRNSTQPESKPICLTCRNESVNCRDGGMPGYPNRYGCGLYEKW